VYSQSDLPTREPLDLSQKHDTPSSGHVPGGSVNHPGSNHSGEDFWVAPTTNKEKSGGGFHNIIQMCGKISVSQ